MRYTRYIAALVALVVATACAVDGFEQSLSTQDGNSDAVTVIGRMTRFDDKEVVTRGVKNDDEAKLTSMALAVFPVKADGSGLDGACVYYQYSANQQELLFTIERGTNYAYDKPYVMYVFTNMPGMSGFGQGSTLDEMMAVAYNVEGLNIPENGFPMMGSLGDTFSTTFDKDNQTFILSPTDVNNHLVAPTVGGETKNLLTIAMKAMYAKVNFTIQVKADQQIEGNYSPQFTMSGYTINNVPSTVDFNNTTNSDTQVLSGSYSLPVSGNTIASGANAIRFSFYLPERHMTPTTSAEDYKYPFGENGAKITGYSNLRDEDKKYAQRYKGKLLGADQKATNIVVSGTFRDHQNLYWDVDYTIYLGEDNYSDFNILRNSEYNNYITIRGIQSSSDMSDNATAISIDHRVNVERTQPAIISLRRETLLDSHFEVRPLRIRKSEVESVGDINAVKVEVVNPSTTNWMRIERSFGDGVSTNDPTNSKGESIYINDGGVSHGKRRYFTANLITGSSNATDAALNNSTEVIVPINEADECVWIYVDECTDAGDGVRAGIIRLTYGNLTGSTFTPTTNSAFPVVNYTINQRKLFKVVYDANNDNKLADTERVYYMEYEEEYLHNFDADDSYGSTEFGGMPWGLDGIQLSYDLKAVVSSSGSFDGFKDYFMGNYIPYYDFYTSKDTGTMPDENYRRAYNGLTFSNEIVFEVNSQAHSSNTNDDITSLPLNMQPKSAVEYCYNRNKRNNKGDVVSEDWYLPAVDEIEEVVTSKYIDPDNLVKPTYARFKEFQEQYYWSSQPAFFKSLMHYSVGQNLGLGAANPDDYADMYVDDVNRARATSVSYSDGNYIPAPSGAYGIYSILLIDGGMTNNTSYYWNLYDELSDNMSFTYTYKDEGSWFGSGATHTSREYTKKDLPTFDSGNLPRTSKARVRCIRKMN